MENKNKHHDDISGAERVEEGCSQRKEVAEDEETIEAKAAEDKVSIQQILEGMTNEFNKSLVNDSSDATMGKSEVAAAAAAVTPVTITPTTITQIEEPQTCEKTLVSMKISTDDMIIANDATKNENCVDRTPENAEPEEKDETEEEEKLAKPETPTKKENNIAPRIVLTFRTIDENTDYGRKTKISSCSSNLSLVPDELGNCDRIGGVSVKIEHSDETEKSDNEEGKREVEVVEMKNSAEQVFKGEDAKPEKSKEKTKTEMEAATKPEPEPSVTRKRRTRLRVLRYYDLLS